MKTQCLIDLANNNITLEGGNEAKRLIIDFIVDGEEGVTYDFKDVSFGYQFQKPDGTILEESWPIPGIRFGKLEPGLITSADIDLEVDTDYKLLVWYERQIYRHTATKFFNSGRPFKLYDSMIWNAETEDWDFIEPYPEHKDGAIFFWDEGKLQWVEEPCCPEEELTNED